MPHSTARIVTENASRYLVQLCKHWSHKFPVDYTDAAGRISFSDDRACILAAGGGALDMTVEAPDAAGVERMEGVVAEHLLRFAFREALPPVDWHRAP